MEEGRIIHLLTRGVIFFLKDTSLHEAISDDECQKKLLELVAVACTVVIFIF